MSTRFLAAIQGSLKTYMATELQSATQAVSAGLVKATDGLKNDLRDRIVQAGLGERLSKSIRGDLYPRGAKSLNAAGFVYTKAPQIISAFAYGTVIRGKSGQFLTIPTSLVPRRSGKRMTPRDFANGGQKLIYIPPRGSRRVGLLVLENQRITSKGRARDASKRAVSKGQVADAIMFILVPQVTLTKRFDYDSAGEKWVAMLPDLINESWPQG